MIPKRILLPLAIVFLSTGMAAGKVIQPDDKSGDDIRAAATQFLNDLADGKEKEARAEFAGTGDAAKLLDRMITCVALCDQWRDAIKSRFGDSPSLKDFGADTDIHKYLKSLSDKTITVDDAGAAATIPPGTQFIIGLELKKVDGKWRVSYPAAQHDVHEELLVAEIDTVNNAIPPFLDRLKKGDFANTDDAMKAVGERVEADMKAIAATRPALNPDVVSPPDTQPQ